MLATKEIEEIKKMNDSLGYVLDTIERQEKIINKLTDTLVLLLEDSKIMDDPLFRKQLDVTIEAIQMAYG